MKLKLLSLAAVLGSALLTAPVQARDFADIYTECGLGAMIAPNNGTVAAVTNVTWDLGTTAVSSNVSSEDSCSGGKKKTAAYIFQALRGGNLGLIPSCLHPGDTMGQQAGKQRVVWQTRFSATSGGGLRLLTG